MSKAYSPAISSRMSRRDFLKLMAAAGVVMTFTPFVDWGKFLPNNMTSVAKKARIELKEGEPANIHSFPVNHSEVVIYPKTNDEVLNTESFRTWQLIRLPLELGGGKNEVSAFRLYSMVCLHLWCLWRYESKLKMIACPCHASTYDPFNGQAYAGPASLQSPPSNVLPRLDLETDKDGDIWILPPTWDPRKNGVVGYGRYVA
ncbi:MAG TPA: twin-arginine translocation signal domain-containing protein [Nitrososphaera sp.]|jgi:ubiquinol-cytochrome c reductase iron-sulfur subunit|nr:twin-arginine translocation signal domain-containing protein [Nitrososphaera sp.]